MLEFTKIGENSYILKGDDDMEYKVKPENEIYRVTYRKYGLNNVEGSGSFKNLADAIWWVYRYDNMRNA